MLKRTFATLFFTICIWHLTFAGAPDKPLPGETLITEPMLDEVPPVSSPGQDKSQEKAIPATAAKQALKHPESTQGQAVKAPGTPGKSNGKAAHKPNTSTEAGKATTAAKQPKEVTQPDEANPSEEVKSPEEVFVPALLSVESKTQHAYACQYWVKLANRLPYKIRDLPLRFSAYIQNPDYPEPVLFESLTRSFFEMRPTEEQYIDLFYMHVRCNNVLFIKVEDTGTCTIGETTAFTSQAGDCSRYITLQESPLVKTVKATTSGEQPVKREAKEVSKRAHQVTTLIKQEHIERLIAHFIDSYGAGDLESLMEIFDKSTQHEGMELGAIREHYARLFKTSQSRTMGVQSLSWHPLTERTAQLTFHTWGHLEQSGFFDTTGYLEEVDMRVELRDKDLVVIGFIARKL